MWGVPRKAFRTNDDAAAAACRMRCAITNLGVAAIERHTCSAAATRGRREMDVDVDLFIDEKK